MKPFNCNFLLFLTLFGHGLLGQGAIPPEPKDTIVGEQEYLKHKPFLNSATLPLNKADKVIVAVYLESPSQKLVHFEYSDFKVDPPVMYFSGCPNKQPLYRQPVLPRLDNAIAPIFNKLYCVEQAKIPVHIQVVVLGRHGILPPRGDTRILHQYCIFKDLSTVALKGVIDPFTGKDTLTGYTYKILDFNQKDKSCTLRLTPLPAAKDILKEHEVTLRKDSILDLHGSKHKILSVVPPQDIPDVGHVIGWVELDPTPEVNK